MASLPPSDSPELHLVVATAEEHLSQSHANSNEWRGALALPAYLRREQTLFNQALTKDGGLTAWALVYQPAGSGEDARQVVCGCETIRKKALASSDGVVTDVIAHGVASVFCPKEFRGKGYAGRMMTDIGEKLKTWQSQGRENLFSVLWSDIGKDFYAARGWKAFPSSHISLTASAEASPYLPQVKLLKAPDLPPLCELDEHSLRKQLAGIKKPAVALLPYSATFAWHHAREDFVANELFNRKPEIKGAYVAIGSQGAHAWCAWTRMFTDPNDEDANTLHILRLVIQDPNSEHSYDFDPATEDGVARVQDSDTVEAVEALFTAARQQAAEWSMDHVEFWNPNAVALAAARKLDGDAVVHERENASICSLRWYGEGNGDDLQWVCNEKYAWC